MCNGGLTEGRGITNGGPVGVGFFYEGIGVDSAGVGY
jgi:hypothetical protein